MVQVGTWLKAHNLECRHEAVKIMFIVKTLLSSVFIHDFKVAPRVRMCRKEMKKLKKLNCESV